MSGVSPLSLYPFQSADASFFASLASDRQVTRFVGDGQPWDEETITSRISSALDHIPVGEAGAVRWFIATRDTDRVGLLVSTRHEQSVEIGYWVSPEYWGTGVAGAMVDEAITTLPDLFGTSMLIARVDRGNEASARVLRRRGFMLDSHVDGLDKYIKRITSP